MPHPLRSFIQFVKRCVIDQTLTGLGNMNVGVVDQLVHLRKTRQQRLRTTQARRPKDKRIEFPRSSQALLQLLDYRASLLTDL